jgi:hypothetical protein
MFVMVSVGRKIYEEDLWVSIEARYILKGINGEEIQCCTYRGVDLLPSVVCDLEVHLFTWSLGSQKRQFAYLIPAGLTLPQDSNTVMDILQLRYKYDSKTS